MQTSVTAATRAASPQALAGASDGSTVMARPHTATVESPSSQANRCAVDIVHPAQPRRTGGGARAVPSRETLHRTVRNDALFTQRVLISPGSNPNNSGFSERECTPAE